MSFTKELEHEIREVFENSGTTEYAVFEGEYGTLEVKAMLTTKHENVFSESKMSVVDTSTNHLECLSDDVVVVYINDKVSFRDESFYIVDIEPTVYKTTLLYISKDAINE